MTRIHTARIAAPGRELPVAAGHEPLPLPRNLVIATIGPRSPVLVGADWVRIDGGQSPITASALRRKHAPSPALFDIPGTQTRRYRNLLTTTESLVFAASEGFDWVNLHDLEHPAELDRARCFLGEDTRLSCSVSDPRVLQRHFDELCHYGDAVLLDLRSLGQKLPPSYLESLMRAVLSRAREHMTPALLISGLMPMPIRQSGSAAAESGQLEILLSAGYHGLVLTRETELTADPQHAVDLARSLVTGAAAPDDHGRKHHGARVLGDIMDDSSGWPGYKD